jgi:hypothetical protein
MKHIKKKKAMMGGMNNLIFASITFVVLVVVLVIGSQIVTTIKGTQTADTSAYNVSAKGEAGFKTFGDYLTIIATIIILVVIVGLLIGVIALFATRK